MAAGQPKLFHHAADAVIFAPAQASHAGTHLHRPAAGQPVFLRAIAAHQGGGQLLPGVLRPIGHGGGQNLGGMGSQVCPLRGHAAAQRLGEGGILQLLAQVKVRENLPQGFRLLHHPFINFLHLLPVPGGGGGAGFCRCAGSFLRRLCRGFPAIVGKEL